MKYSKMISDKVYYVGEEGELVELTDDIVVAVPIPEESEDEDDIDENEVTQEAIPATNKVKNAPFILDNSTTPSNDIQLNDDDAASGLEQTVVADIHLNVPHASTSAGKPVPAPVNHNFDRRSIVWKKDSFPESDTNFTGNSELPQEIINLESPYDYFCYFFDNELIDLIADQSCLFSIQSDPSRPVSTTPENIRQYLGIIIFTSVVSMRNLRLYWNTLVGLSIIKETMPLNKFETIRRFLHFSDNSANTGGDKLYKIRPVLNKLNSRFDSIPKEENLCVDEQMCATKARHTLKVYMPDKPHKYGYKLYLLSGSSGFTYNLEIYSGKENENRPDNEPDLGSSSNVVVRLSRNVPANCNHKIFFDNYYTSLRLMEFLHRRGILSVGTARKNRIYNCKQPNDVEAKKLPRGECIEYVADVDGCKISNVMWKDNKPVMMLSTLVGSDPIGRVRRFDRKTKEYVTVACPKVISIYNENMGGVDNMDSMNK